MRTGWSGRPPPQTALTFWQNEPNHIGTSNPYWTAGAGDYGGHEPCLSLSARARRQNIP